jgi:hypothetical protein
MARNKFGRSRPFTDDEIRAFHARNHAGENLEEIAKPYGIGGASIRYYMMKLGLACRSLKESQQNKRGGYITRVKIAAAYDEWKAGRKKQDQIAAELGCSISNVCQRFDRLSAKQNADMVRAEDRPKIGPIFYQSEFIRPITPQRAMARR